MLFRRFLPSLYLQRSLRTADRAEYTRGSCIVAPEKTTDYKPVDGLRYRLQQRYLENREQFPPDNIDYVRNFQNIEEHLNTNVHREVVTGAALRGYGLLNDHGEEHVSMVIQRAGLILEDRVEQLSGFEIYLLLLAIHFHDVGNIYGRDAHETRILEVMEALGKSLPMDNPSRKRVAEIAMAHGGKINNSKDTISPLLNKDYLSGRLIRPSLLASLLRFSDEIADDNTRAARFLMDADLLPPANEAFHYYSRSLEPVAIEGKTLILKYDFSEELAKGKVHKEHAKNPDKVCTVYLYDDPTLQMLM